MMLNKSQRKKFFPFKNDILEDKDVGYFQDISNMKEMIQESQI